LLEDTLLSTKSRSQIQKLRDELPDSRSALLEAYTLAQSDFGGWLPEAALKEVAELMNLSPTYVASVASFYTMLNLKPVGRHLIQVCTNISCSLLGAEHIVQHLSQKLGIRPGETTSDGKFTLLEVECLGSCGTAPMMQVDDQVHENLSPGKVDEILASL
jgi:NADH-quinone oxidoreductase subunit E